MMSAICNPYRLLRGAAIAGALAGSMGLPHAASRADAEQAGFVALDATTRLGRQLAERVTVYLEDLRVVSEVAPSARPSMREPRPYGQPVGVRVQPGAVEGSRAWDAAPLVKSKAALQQVRFIDGDASRHIRAGYRITGTDGSVRVPWMNVVSSETEGLFAQAEFVVRSGHEAAKLALREVAAMDGESIYFHAARVEETGRPVESGPLLVAARYSLAARAAD